MPCPEKELNSITIIVGIKNKVSFLLSANQQIMRQSSLMK